MTVEEWQGTEDKPTKEQYIPTGKQYATNSESMRAQARLFRNLGDNVTANKWDIQAQQEENYERGNQ